MDHSEGSLDGHGDGDSFSLNDNEREVDAEGKESKYGREYAIKVLSKGNLDEEALSAQMFEVRVFTFNRDISFNF